MKKTVLQLLLSVGIVALGSFISFKMINIPKQAELVVFFALLLLYPIFKYPTMGIYTAFIISPFIPFVRRLYYLVYGRPGMDPLIMVADIIVVVVFVGLFFEFRERLKENEQGGYLKLLAFYLAYLIVRTFFLNGIPVAEAAAKLKFYAPGVLLYFIGWIYAHRFYDLKRLWGLTIVIGAVACLYGYKQLYFGYSAAEKIWFSSISFTSLFIKGVARPFSFFQSPAVFADYCMLAIIAALMFMSWNTMRARFLLMFALPVLFYGVLITSVRSNWIGAVSVFFFWFVFLNIKKTGNRVIVLLIVVAVFFSYQFVEDVIKTGSAEKDTAPFTGLGGGGAGGSVDLLVISRTGAITNPFQEHSLVSRMELWRYIFTTSFSLENALFGRGLGVLNADSLYFTYLAEFGYPGLAFIVFIIIVFIAHGVRAIGTVRDRRAIILVKGIVVMDMALAVMSFTGTHIHSFPGDMYFWFFNGVLMNIVSCDKSLSGEPTKV
jgi:hypothetical protein